MKRTSIGFATPGRVKVTLIFVPGVPMRVSETCWSFHPSVEAVSTLTMRSPSMIPACSAGVFGKTRLIVMRPF